MNTERCIYSDRELLELVAEAAGYFSDGLGTLYDPTREAPCNPLEDDGDAFRLLVKLIIELTRGSSKSNLFKPELSKYLYAIASESVVGTAQVLDTDHLAATRRAIAVAAAEYGKSLQDARVGVISD